MPMEIRFTSGSRYQRRKMPTIQPKKRVETCDLEGIPSVILQDILHRASCSRLIYSESGCRILEANNESGVKRPWKKWAHVTELCRLQLVSKRFYHVASLVQNLQCTIDPLHAKGDLRGLKGFLARARCAKGLVLTLTRQRIVRQLPNVLVGDGVDTVLDALSSLFNNLSKGLARLFPRAPLLEQFAVVWKVQMLRPEIMMCEDSRPDEIGAASTNRMFKALAASCPRLRTLAIGDCNMNFSHSLRFLCLAASSGLERKCRPFSQLRRLVIQDSARDVRAISNLIGMCPKLQHLEIEDFYRYEKDRPKVPGCFLVQSESLEALDIWFPSRDVLLDIRTPRLCKLALRDRAGGLTAISAPELRHLETQGSSRLTVSAEWKLETLVIKPDKDLFCRMNAGGALQEAVRSSSGLTFLSFDTPSAVLGDATGFLRGLRESKELRIPSVTLVEACRSIEEPVKMPELKELTLLFTRSGLGPVDGKLVDVAQSITVEGFPKLECLTLDTGGCYSSRSVRALIALHLTRPSLKLVF